MIRAAITMCRIFMGEWDVVPSSSQVAISPSVRAANAAFPMQIALP
jgi:hypothetical protein